MTDPSKNVMVLGATNRPYDLDQAILRRLPRTFEIGLPSEDQRKNIMHLLLRDESVEGSKEVLCTAVAAKTPQFSGSDLKELCRAAVLVPIRELAARERSTRPGDRVLPQECVCALCVCGTVLRSCGGYVGLERRGVAYVRIGLANSL